MKNSYLLLFLVIAGCASKHQIEVGHKAEKEIIGNTGAPNGECNKCAASELAESEPDTAFNFTNGSKLLICGYSEPSEGRKIYSEFVLSECGYDSIIDFWGAVEEYEVEFAHDTFRLQKLELLALTDNREFVKKKWLTESFYYKDGKLKRDKKLNPEVKYSQSQIDQSLHEYESTQWQTQNGATEEYAEEKMRLANRLLIAAVSGSEKAELYFIEFDSKFKPDGAYAEWYQQMTDMLEFARK